MIHIFTSKGQLHLDGHKDLSKDEPIQTVQPAKVYVPAVCNKGAPLAGALAVGTKVKKGTLLGVRNDFQLPVYSPVCGEITGLVKLTSLAIGRPVNFFEITVGPDEGEEKLLPLAAHDRESVVAKLKEGGIVGLGGAGFPAYIKYNTKDPIDTVLINAVECEPYLTTDYVEGIARMEDAFLAFPALLEATGAKEIVIATKNNKVALIESMLKSMAKHPELQGRVRVVKVPDAYPMGWEKTLIKAALHRTYDGLPSQAGVIVNNLQTMMAIGRLFAFGEVITSKVFTVSGEVGAPGNYLAPVGTPMIDLIKAAGGYSYETVALLAGGPMTSKAVMNDQTPTLLATSGLTVLNPLRIPAEEPCLRCGACTDHCPANLQPVEIKDADLVGDLERARALKAEACVECGLCAYVCPSHINVTAHVAKMKLMIRLKAAPKPAAKK